jgi:hypothetical protein
VARAGVEPATHGFSIPETDKHSNEIQHTIEETVQKEVQSQEGLDLAIISIMSPDSISPSTAPVWQFGSVVLELGGSLDRLDPPIGFCPDAHSLASK